MTKSSPTRLLDPPGWFDITERVVPAFWVAPLPVATWVIAVLRPRVLVELGTRSRAFCQAAAALGLARRCVTVDIRTGHEGALPQSGGRRSTVLATTSGEAAGRFADGAIDLLHIDGPRSDEAVRLELETWRPKMSQRGVILYHVAQESGQDLGNVKAGSESTARSGLASRRPHSLKALAVDRDAASGAQPFSEQEKPLVQRAMSARQPEPNEQESTRLMEIVRALAAPIERQGWKASGNDASLPGCRQHGLAWIGSALAPHGSAPRYLLNRVVRVSEVARRQGLGAVASKLSRRVREQTLARWVKWFRSRAPWQPDNRLVFLLIHHDAAGGTLRHVRDLIAGLCAQNTRVVTLRPGRTGELLWEEHAGGRVAWSRFAATDPATIRAVLAELRPAHAHCHHMMGLPPHLIDQLVAEGIRYDWSLHDYFAVCPRGHFNLPRGVYCGEPDAETCQSCLRRFGDYRGEPTPEPIEQWRRRFAQYLSGARRVFAPSDDTRRRLARHFPHVAIELRPYSEALPDLRRPVPPLGAGAKVRAAVIGMIVEHKGSEVLLACARDAIRHRLPLEFVVFGTTDCNAALARLGNVRITGPYAERHVYERLAAAGCHVALLPTPVPETYMYTLSIAMAAGLFPVCFDLGAQADRVKAWGWGQTIAVASEPGFINQVLRASAESIVGELPPPAPATAFYADTLEAYYGFVAANRTLPHPTPPPHGRAGQIVPDPNFVQRNIHARLH